MEYSDYLETRTPAAALTGDEIFGISQDGEAAQVTLDEIAAFIGSEGGTVIADYVTSETPSGTVDGSNDTFTLADTPIGFVHVYVNGVLYEGGGDDYTLTTATIVFVTPPLTGWKIRVSYIK